MTEKVVQANPTKEFFVNMLVRDILLKQAIIELIDNSIDGAKSIRENGQYEGLWIEVNFDKDKFTIKDNCGGMPLEVAANYAFRFGRSQSRQNSGKETTGIFGIGMKRALFKIGNYFSIHSTTDNTTFKIDLNVKEWVKNDDKDWDFKFTSYQENMSNPSENIGTAIEVTDLNEEVANELSDTSFEKEVIDHVQRRVGLDIVHGLKISVNGKDLVGNNILLIDNEEIKPVKEEYFENDVDVKIIAGIAPRDGAKYLPENAGWYIYCNGRLVIAADKTSLTTWKDMENKSSGVVFHNDYAAFRGIVYFNSTKPEKLPWNTTKTGIDESSFVYLKAREKMLEVFKILKEVLDEIKKTTKEKDDGVEETIATMKGVELTTENAQKIVANRELTIKRVKVVTDPQVSINYKKPKKDADQIKELLGAKTYREVGEKTFEYYKDMEC